MVMFSYAVCLFGCLFSSTLQCDGNGLPRQQVVWVATWMGHGNKPVTIPPLPHLWKQQIEDTSHKTLTYELFLQDIYS